MRENKMNPKDFFKRRGNALPAVCAALLAAAFYAVNIPLSKLLMNEVPPTMTASFLYLGAGIGIGVIYLFRFRKEAPAEKLSREDLPYTVAMILLDVLAPILLMLGIRIGSAANASLLGNFEIAATSLIAWLFFRERVSGRLWIAVLLITLSGILLSFEEVGSFRFSLGSLSVIGATVCWGIENNCTRKISGKSAYQIVLVKGIFSGGCSFAVALTVGEKLPFWREILLSMLLGFFAYGLSIFLYVRAQKSLGAAKTSAYYAVAPFVGAALSFAIFGEKPSLSFAIALPLMIAGTAFVNADTLRGSKASEINRNS